MTVRSVGKGTHEELLKTCDAYYQIAASQLSESELKEAMKEKTNMAKRTVWVADTVGAPKKPKILKVT